MGVNLSCPLVHERPGANHSRGPHGRDQELRLRIHTRSPGYRAEIAAGPVRVDFTNATDARYALLVVNLPGDYEWAMKPFLSGSQLLSNQTFLDLFESETIVAAEGLAVKRLALLFTDI
jgi:hypothetical protein